MEDNKKFIFLNNFFKDFPGVGLRQSRRFVYYILKKSDKEISEFLQNIENIRKEYFTCNICNRVAELKDSVCLICTDTKRSKKQLLIVSKESDVESLEKSGSYKGQYFKIGSMVSVLNENTPKFVGIDKLKNRILENDTTEEIIFALPFNATGDYTENYIKEHISKICSEKGIKVVTLGRGLSQGSEIEYSDSETIKLALDSRS